MENNTNVLVKSRRVNGGFDWFHISFLIDGGRNVVYTQVSLTNGNIVWNIQSLEDYLFDFKSSIYNDENYIEYINRGIIN